MTFNQTLNYLEEYIQNLSETLQKASLREFVDIRLMQAGGSLKVGVKRKSERITLSTYIGIHKRLTEDFQENPPHAIWANGLMLLSGKDWHPLVAKQLVELEITKDPDIEITYDFWDTKR